ncbi:MAG: hypothetical protein ACQESR_27935 [Planctomycetota bacterium]
MESCPTQAVLPLVGLAKYKVAPTGTPIFLPPTPLDLLRAYAHN